MTSQGSPHTRLKLALRGKSILNIDAAARECGRLGLPEALAVSLAFLKAEQPERYKRAAVRWHARYVLEVKPSAEESTLVASALTAMAGGHREAHAGAEALAVLLEERGLRHEAEYLADYAERFD
jgi:hypothetical protein